MAEQHRAELRGAVRALRAWVEWQRENGADGLPLPAEPVRSAPMRAAPQKAAPRPPASRAEPRPSPPPQRAPQRAPQPPPQRAPQPPPQRAPQPVAEALPAAAPAALGLETLSDVRRDLGDCRRCRLCEGRSTIVFGVGDPGARLMFVGEGPGYHEDRLGEPFVGKAGQLLDKMIGAMGLSRDEVYIANVVKCRPPDNRDPRPDEVGACSPFLYRQIASISPEVIVALGRPAAHTLIGTDRAISRLRGNWSQLQVEPRTPIMPTFHPAYLLRNEGEKRAAWQDLQAVMAKLGLQPPPRRR